MDIHPPQPQDLNLVINNLRKQLRTFLADIKNQTGVPGISLAMNIGKPKLFTSVGTLSIDSHEPMNENTHFQLGCISKLMTALIAAELIEAGKLDHDDPIEKYLNELRGTDRGKNLRIWHLLSHTSGYRGVNINDPGVAYYYTWPKFIEYFKTTPQLFKPGTVFSYEHSEYAILGEIIKRITDQDILDLYREMITNPLKLATGSIHANKRGDEPYAGDHAFDPDSMKFKKLMPVPFGNFWNASLNSITMSIKDILRLSSTICGILKPPPGISENALKFIQKQVIKLPRTYGSSRHEQIPGAFGVGCAFYRGWLLGHNGSARGQTCGLRFDPRSNIALVIGINVWQPFFRDSIINHIFGSLRGQPIGAFPEEPLESSLTDFVGTYIGPQGNEIVVSFDNDQLTCTLNNLNSPPMNIVMQKDEESILRIQSDTQHYSLGFFKEPETGFDGLMLGMLAYRKN